VARLKRKAAGRPAGGQGPGQGRSKARGKAGAPSGRKLAGRGRGATLLTMGSLLKAAVILGALAAVVLLLPLGGRTLADRWQGAAGPEDFARRLWGEVRGEPADRGKPGKPGKRPGARGPATADAGRPAEGKPDAGPAERHSDADQQALDRLVGEHLADPPKR